MSLCPIVLAIGTPVPVAQEFGIFSVSRGDYRIGDPRARCDDTCGYGDSEEQSFIEGWLIFLIMADINFPHNAGRKTCFSVCLVLRIVLSMPGQLVQRGHVSKFFSAGTDQLTIRELGHSILRRP